MHHRNYSCLYVWVMTLRHTFTRSLPSPSTYTDNMRLETGNKPAQLTPQSNTSISVSSGTSDDLESRSSTEDLILKYAKDPPALIACVAHIPHTTFKMTNPLV